MRVAQKLNVAFLVAAVFLLIGGIAAVYLIGNLNDAFHDIDRCNVLIEQVADTSVKVRTEPRALKEHTARLQQMPVLGPEGRALADSALQKLVRGDVPAALSDLDKLWANSWEAGQAAQERMLSLHRRARIAVIFAVFDGALLLVLLAWFVWETFLRPTLRLRAVAGKMARGESPPPLHFDSKDEYSELADALNEAAGMMDRQKERFERLERHAAVGEACTHIAHNLRGLLGGIRTLAQYERDAPTATEDSRAAFDYILGTAEALDGWARDIVGAVRPLELKRARQSLEPIVRDVLAMWQPRLSERSLNVQFDPGDSVAEVFVDRQLLQQAIGALLGNAMEASPDNGRIGLRTVTGPDTQVVLSVQDEGEGIADEIREKVFTPFFTTKEGGAGLGLTIAQRIIAEHGGRITIENGDGKGTCVSIFLPSASANRSPS